MSNYDDTTWRLELIDALKKNSETLNDLIHKTLSSEELDKVFDGSYGGQEGIPFTAWTNKNVYFPICYDGSEWVGSAPRNPCEIKLNHQGGG